MAVACVERKWLEGILSSSTHGMVVHGWGVVLQVCIYWPLTLEATREIALGQFLFS